MKGFAVEVRLADLDSPTLAMFIEWLVVVGLLQDHRQLSGDMTVFKVMPPAHMEEESDSWATIAAQKLRSRGIMAQKIRLENEHGTRICE